MNPYARMLRISAMMKYLIKFNVRTLPGLSMRMYDSSYFSEDEADLSYLIACLLIQINKTIT